MGMGNGSAIDTDSIDASVETMRQQLGRGVSTVRYRYTQGGLFKERDGPPREARVTVTPGIHQQAGYFDIEWWENGDYKYHYREEGLAFRFGRENANESSGQPIRHFHPPENLDEHRPSCIDSGHPPERVTLAVLATWWAAVEKGDEGILNSQDSLP